LPYFFGTTYQKEKNSLNENAFIKQCVVKYQKMQSYQFKIFHCLLSQNIPKFEFVYENKPFGNPGDNGAKKRGGTIAIQGCQIFLASAYQNGENIPNN
jgi:hypothetical protein